MDVDISAISVPVLGSFLCGVALLRLREAPAGDTDLAKISTSMTWQFHGKPDEAGQTPRLRQNQMQCRSNVL
jgi:hypothetical protein